VIPSQETIDNYESQLSKAIQDIFQEKVLREQAENKLEDEKNKTKARVQDLSRELEEARQELAMLSEKHSTRETELNAKISSLVSRMYLDKSHTEESSERVKALEYEKAELQATIRQQQAEYQDVIAGLERQLIDKSVDQGEVGERDHSEMKVKLEGMQLKVKLLEEELQRATLQTPSTMTLIEQIEDLKLTVRRLKEERGRKGSSSSSDSEVEELQTKLQAESLLVEQLRSELRTFKDRRPSTRLTKGGDSATELQNLQSQPIAQPNRGKCECELF
jgi:hypothetical protein